MPSARTTEPWGRCTTRRSGDSRLTSSPGRWRTGSARSIEVSTRSAPVITDAGVRPRAGSGLLGPGDADGHRRQVGAGGGLGRADRGRGGGRAAARWAAMASTTAVRPIRRRRPAAGTASRRGGRWPRRPRRGPPQRRRRVADAGDVAQEVGQLQAGQAQVGQGVEHAVEAGAQVVDGGRRLRRLDVLAEHDPVAERPRRLVDLLHVEGLDQHLLQLGGGGDVGHEADRVAGEEHGPQVGEELVAGLVAVEGADDLHRQAVPRRGPGGGRRPGPAPGSGPAAEPRNWRSARSAGPPSHRSSGARSLAGS